MSLIAVVGIGAKSCTHKCLPVSYWTTSRTRKRQTETHRNNDRRLCCFSSLSLSVLALCVARHSQSLLSDTKLIQCPYI